MFAWEILEERGATGYVRLMPPLNAKNRSRRLLATSVHGCGVGAPIMPEFRAARADQAVAIPSGLILASSLKPPKVSSVMQLGVTTHLSLEPRCADTGQSAIDVIG